MKILAIETSCDETAAAVTEDRRVLGHALYSQILIHKKWGGVVPSLAKRAHEEKIDFVIEEALKKAKTTVKDLEYIAVTYGPGLAIALEVGIRKAKELSGQHKKPLIAVNHMAGHIYANFAQNSKGRPEREFEFPYLALLVSGGHTELVYFENHHEYEVLGETVDDAAGEALDKAAKMLGLGYPGGEVIERLSTEVNNEDRYKFPRPMSRSRDINFSFSGLKTHFLYFLRKMDEEEINKNIQYLASSFQEAVVDSLVSKSQIAVEKTGIHRLILGGGVSANLRLRSKLKEMLKKHTGSLTTPPYKYLCTDNAAMIGVAAHFQAEKGDFVKDLDTLDRVPRLRLGEG
jgi:N6-L-threonylcarbamoyladenine synthase